MKKNFKILFLLLLSILITTALLYFLQKKNQITLVKLNKGDYAQDFSTPTLKYFYEPIPGKPITTVLDWREKPIQNTINEDSFNDRFDYQIEKPSDTFRIITLGDSYTFGHNVNTPDNYSEVLEDLLNRDMKCKDIKKFEVINLGVNGYDIQYTIERFLRRGLKYQPDLALWLLNDWNFERINEYMIPWGKSFISQGVPEFNPDKGIYEAAVKSFDKLRKDYGEAYISDYQKKTEDQLKNYYRGRMIIFHFESFNPSRQPLLSYLLENNSNYTILTLSDEILRPTNRLQDGHPNEDGHKEIAETMVKSIKTSTSFPCY